MCDLKFTRNMPYDERDIFLSIYNQEVSKLIDKARKEAQKRVGPARKARRDGCIKRLEEVNQEIPALQAEVTTWKESNGGGQFTIMPEKIGNARDRAAKLFREKERLERIIKDLTGDK